MIRTEEYARLLGYPAGKSLQGAVLERAEQASSWYERHGRPRVFVRDGVVAITAGAEVEAKIARLWGEDRIDEAYFLDRFAAGVVEHLVRSNRASPGTKGWAVEHHIEFMSELMLTLGPEAPVELLPSGMLKPVHSVVAEITGESTTCSQCKCRCDFRRTA